MAENTKRQGRCFSVNILIVHSMVKSHETYKQAINNLEGRSISRCCSKCLKVQCLGDRSKEIKNPNSSSTLWAIQSKT